MTGDRGPWRPGRHQFVANSCALGLVAASSVRIRRANSGPSPIADVRLRIFEGFVNEAVTRLGVPGVAIGVIEGGEASLLQGFGTLAPGDSAPVTADTLMMVDSLTKPMTTLLAATQIDAGTLSWEMPARDLLPAFALKGADSGRPLAVGDLFCNCAGVPRNDAESLFNASKITPEHLIAMAATLTPNARVGERFQYSNRLFAIGGYAAARAAQGHAGGLREAYRRAMQAYVLDPIGMPNSTFSLADARQSDNYATPSAPTLTGELEPLSLEGEEAFTDAVEPAGSVWSSAREMARFLQTQLSGGVSPDGRRVAHAETLQETWRPHVAIPGDPSLTPPLAGATQGYGLGWFTGEYDGRRLLSHDGGISGFVSRMAMLPDEEIGVVVLTNGGSGAHAFALAAPFRLFELLLGQPPVVEGILGQQIEGAASQAEDRLAQLGIIDEERVEPYTGHYANGRLGKVTLAIVDGQFIFDAGEIRSSLLPHLDEAGQITDYRFVAPPLANLPVSLTLSEGENTQPTVALTIAGEGAGSYIFDHLETAAATPIR